VRRSSENRANKAKTEEISLTPFSKRIEPYKNFSSEKSGRVRVLVDEGSKVRIGQTLAIVRSQITSDLNTAEAAYQNAWLITTVLKTHTVLRRNKTAIRPD
jgi:predicted deacylase